MAITPPHEAQEREVLHMDYQSGAVQAIGRVIERRRRERGRNYLDLLRKARLRYGRSPYDIGAIFLGHVVARLRVAKSRRLRLV
jgi:hypothetical protein